MSITLNIPINQMVLTTGCHVYKTERFVKQTGRFNGIDRLLDIVSMGLMGTQLPAITTGQMWRVELEHNHVFWVTNGAWSGTAPLDIVFCGYDSTQDSPWKIDERFTHYLSGRNNISAQVSVRNNIYSRADAEILYRLSHEDRMYFPRLNEEQAALVIEDKNVLVQGVAGSGKTNVCLDKIIYTACRGYHGRTLYTTYSRGLLADTKNRLYRSRQNIRDLLDAIQEKRVRFVGEPRDAVGARLGLYLDASDERTLQARLEEVVAYLESKVDFCLVEDIYQQVTGERVRLADEGYFIKQYCTNNPYLTGRLAKLKGISHEVLFKEIYGLIGGKCNPQDMAHALSIDEYKAMREGSFSPAECDAIFSIATDYEKHLMREGLTDNNRLSRELLCTWSDSLPQYSLVLADEVQDFGEVTLVLLSKMAAKMFAVGDALQMINPSFFRFAYLKNLLYHDVARVAELKRNYRCSPKIESLIDACRALNAQTFGTHSFVLGSKAVCEDENTRTAYIQDTRFVDALKASGLEDITVVVPTQALKQDLRARLPKEEVLTVSEIKGLERDTVVLYHVLDTHLLEWQSLARKSVNRKTADENSVYRYYFNLFYVGISRARRNLYIVEGNPPSQFVPLLNKEVERLDKEVALKELLRATGKRLDREELLRRIEQFIRLGQYDNADQTADRLEDADKQKARIRAYRQHWSVGDYRATGIALWQLGFLDEAKNAFVMGEEHALLALLDANRDRGELSIDMLRYYPLLQDNEQALTLLNELVATDLSRLKETNKSVFEAIKRRKKENRL